MHSNVTHKVVKALHHHRRGLCAFEDLAIQAHFTNITINRKMFNRNHGFPQYQSYDLLASTLLSQSVLTPQMASPAAMKGRGMWLEFGVAEGSSINITAHSLDSRGFRTHVEVVGFDSFEGLPYDWMVGEGSNRRVFMRKGMFSLHGMLPPVRGNVQLVKGWFEQTLQSFLQQHTEHYIVGVNIDNDLYDGARYILEAMYPLLRVGSVLHFHELFSSRKENNPMAELRALVEFLGNHTMSVELLPVKSSLDEAAAFVVTKM